MNFIACDGAWSAGASGELLCTGTLVSVPGEEMQNPSGSALTWDQVSELQGEAIGVRLPDPEKSPEIER
jgi:hypothetical protein